MFLQKFPKILPRTTWKSKERSIKFHVCEFDSLNRLSLVAVVVFNMSGLQKQQTILYVGGLAAEVTEEVLHAAFIPFGDIKSIQISKDYVKSKLFTNNCHLQILICSFSLYR